jgi:hypothetical protein
MITVTITTEQLQRIMQALTDDASRDAESLAIHSYLHELLKRDRK